MSITVASAAPKRPYARPRAVASQARVSPILAAVAVAALLVPEEASLYVGSLRLPVARAILLVMSPILLARLVRHAGTRAWRPTPSDWLVPLTALWMVIAVSMTEGLDRGVVGAGAIGLELVGSYLAGRMLLGGPGQAVAFAKLLAVLIAGTALTALPDPLAHDYVFHHAVESLTGYHVPYITDVRNGHFRAAGVMEHPILLGTVCSFGILLSLQLHRGWTRVLLIACQAAGALVAVSSAPLVGLAIGLLCLCYRRLTPSLPSRWRWLILGLAAGLLCLMLALPNPLSTLIGHLTIDPSTGFYRLLEWQFAGTDLLASPWFGLGLSDAWARPDWMPASIDSLWLRSAMSFGIPGSCLIAACLIGACRRPTDVAWASLSPAEQRLGTTLSIMLALYLFQGFSVHFWGATWILMGLFAGMRAHLGALGAASRPRVPTTGAMRPVGQGLRQ